MFDLSLELLRVVEDAAIASARTMGMGDANSADHAAVEAMRRCLDTIAIDGTIVIGEGERDDAPMLYIGEKVGARQGQRGLPCSVDIAVDPLEGTNLCATGAGGAITVLAASERGGLLHAPDCYMEKIIVGPAAKGAVDLDAPVKHNLKAIARRLQRGVDDLVVVVLDRPRHQKLIADIREAGARIRLISDGDLSAGIAAAVAGTGVHAVMGSGGAPEGVLTAAALRCLNGEILGRLVVKDDAQKERMQAMGIRDVEPHLLHPGAGPRRAAWCSPPAASPTETCSRASALPATARYPVRRDDLGAGARPLHRHRPPGEQARRESPLPLSRGGPPC